MNGCSHAAVIDALHVNVVPLEPEEAWVHKLGLAHELGIVVHVDAAVEEEGIESGPNGHVGWLHTDGGFGKGI